MKKQDASKLDHKTLSELRRRAVKSIKNGESPEMEARVLNVNRATIYGWLANFSTGGWGALIARKRRDVSPKWTVKPYNGFLLP